MSTSMQSLLDQKGLVAIAVPNPHTREMDETAVKRMMEIGGNEEFWTGIHQRQIAMQAQIDASSQIKTAPTASPTVAPSPAL